MTDTHHSEQRHGGNIEFPGVLPVRLDDLGIRAVSGDVRRIGQEFAAWLRTEPSTAPRRDGVMGAAGSGCNGNRHWSDRIPEILSRVDLSTLVEDVAGLPTRVTRTTATFHCPNPAHPDKTPSFAVTHTLLAERAGLPPTKPTTLRLMKRTLHSIERSREFV